MTKNITACKIAEGSFGSTFLSNIGFALEIEAEEYIGYQKSHWDGARVQTKKNLSSTATNFKITGAAIKAASAGHKAYREVEAATSQSKIGGSDGKTDTEKQTEQAMLAAKKFEESLPSILELAWGINTRDIRNTLREACKKLFADSAATMEQRLVRAKAVKVIGAEFLAIGKLVGSTKGNEHMDLETIKSRAEVAVMTTMAKAQGQEVNENDTEDLIRQHKEMSAQRDVKTSTAQFPLKEPQ